MRSTTAAQALRRIALSISFLSLCSSAGVAATITEPRPLMQIRSLAVIGGDVAKNRCGMTRDAVVAAVSAAVSHSRMKMVAAQSTARDGYLYASVIVTSDCSAASVELSFNTGAVILANKRTFYAANIWSIQSLLTGYDLRTRVFETLTQDTQKFVAEWSAANP